LLYKYIESEAIMKTLLLSVALIISASTAFAETVNARVTDVITNYTYVSNPVDVEYCRNVEVPVYKNVQGGSTGDVLAGAIIGGAIGNQFGGGSGKDAMTVLGAIVGADVAGRQGNRQQVAGYRNEVQCEYHTEYQDQRVVDGYIVYFRYGQHVGSVVTDRYYEVGDRIRITFR
jgi:uncharacterized protein YcfJ